MLYYILLICVLKVSLIHSRSYPECPSGWTSYTHQYCHKVMVTPANAFQAQQVCRSLGGYLADPTDKQELDTIKKVVQKAWDTYGRQDVWVHECFFNH
jgi:hypothetical protein